MLPRVVRLRGRGPFPEKGWASLVTPWLIVPWCGGGVRYVIPFIRGATQGFALAVLRARFRGRHSPRTQDSAGREKVRGRDPSPQPPPLRGEGKKDRFFSPSPRRGGGWGEG